MRRRHSDYAGRGLTAKSRDIEPIQVVLVVAAVTVVVSAFGGRQSRALGDRTGHKRAATIAHHCRR